MTAQDSIFLSFYSFVFFVIFFSSSSFCFNVFRNFVIVLTRIERGREKTGMKSKVGLLKKRSCWKKKKKKVIGKEKLKKKRKKFLSVFQKKRTFLENKRPFHVLGKKKLDLVKKRKNKLAFYIDFFY